MPRVRKAEEHALTGTLGNYVQPVQKESDEISKSFQSSHTGVS